MKIKRLAAVLLLSAILLGNVGCEEAVNTDLGTSVDVPEISDSEDIHIRDKSLLYENQNNTEIVTMYLTVSMGNSAENTDHTWEEINTYSVYDYERMGVDRYKVAGLIQVGDENGLIPGELGYGQVAPNCTVQIRGQSSSLNAQKNYKISIKDNKGDWRGQTTIALNKHQGDGLRFRNKLGFDLLSGIDELMSLRTTFVHLYVKDTTSGEGAKFEDYGIYTQVEQLNKTALKTHGLDKNGHLYKINVCEFYRYEDEIRLTSDPEYDAAAFEAILETKGSDDHTKLISLLEKINDYSIPIENILNEHFDIENIAYWMAFQILIGNVDTQNRNFYMYSPLNSERWYILAWDNDALLKRAEHEVNNRSDYSEWESGVSNYWGNVLFRRCLKSEVFREALDGAMNDLREYLNAERINSMVNTYSELLKPYVYSGIDSIYAPLTEEEYDIVADACFAEVEANYLRYKESLEKPLPFFIGTPTSKNGKITVDWEASYDFDAENITYTFELARDCAFSEVIFKKEDIVIPTVEFELLPEGQYFMRVSAKDQSGNSQYAFDYYITENGKVYGTRCFYVNADGGIVEDTYVED
ncbi:MAG: CotH kinase family protein [Clostridia bacterium]|nr:CotH kinase family protein [Clostridia bacterium]